MIPKEILARTTRWGRLRAECSGADANTVLGEELLGLANGIGALVEDAGGEDGIGAALVEAFVKMVQVADAAAPRKFITLKEEVIMCQLPIK